MHHHSENEASGCSCGPHHECCKKCCHDHHHDGEHEDFSKQLLELADEAWMEVLYDKIKSKIETTNGAKLEQLAQIVADANNARWEAKLSKEKRCDEFEDKIAHFFMNK